LITFYKNQSNYFSLGRVIKYKAKRRHIAKTLTWRVIGTLDTVLVSWFLLGDPMAGLQIGAAEFFTKMVLYYLHERAWFNVEIKNANHRHILKTLTWRAVGTIDTVLLAWFISGDLQMGFEIGVVELISKTLLYYFHERIWYKSRYGMEKLDFE